MIENDALRQKNNNREGVLQTLGSLQKFKSIVGQQLLLYGSKYVNVYHFSFRKCNYNIYISYFFWINSSYLPLKQSIYLFITSLYDYLKLLTLIFSHLYIYLFAYKKWSRLICFIPFLRFLIFNPKIISQQQNEY